MSEQPPAPPSPTPKRVATPSWLDLRLVLGVVLVLGSVLLGAKVVSGAKETHATVTTTRDLAAGTVLTADDLRTAQVQLTDDGTRRYLSATKDAVGRTLTRPVSRGELLPRAAVATTRARTTLTVPLAAGAAPQLRTGQRIELWVSSAACPSVVLLPDVTVQSVRTDDDNTFGGGTGAQNVVIIVDPQQAGRVVRALALEGATVRAGVLVGGAAGSGPPSSGPTSPAAPSAGASQAQGGEASGSASAAAPTDDLAACASASPTR